MSQSPHGRVRRTARRLAALTLVGGLVVVPASLPAMAQSGQATRIDHRQSILTELSATGEPGTSRVFTQLNVVGNGDVELVLPAQSTSGLRNLEGFGRPEVSGDTVTYRVAASSAGTLARTVADHDGDLPVSIEVAYSLDGEPVQPSRIEGASGRLEVTFTVRNLTAQPQDITFFNGQGQPQTETVDVAVPMVGSISTTLGPRFSDVSAPGAAVAGNGRGDTVVSYSLLLFAPVGSEEAEFTYSATISDGVIPDATIQILPVDARSFGAIRSTQDSYKDVASGLQGLTNGALIVDGNAKLLADGAAQLFDGLEQLADGAEQLGEGLAERAGPGSQQLAEGTGTARAGAGELADGLGRLASGAGDLSDGLGQARSGGGELSSGLGELADGAGTLAGGTGQARTGAAALADGLNLQIAPGARQLAAGLRNDAAPGAAQINVGVRGLLGATGSPGDTAADRTLIGGLTSLRGGLAGLPDSVEDGLQENLEAALNGIVLPQLTTSLRNGLASNLQGALAAEMGTPLRGALEDNVESSLKQTLQLQVRPELVAELQEQVEAGVAQSLQAGLTAQLAPNLSGALQLPPPNGLALDQATADEFATGFAGQFAGPFAAGYAASFSAGFAAQVDGQLEDAFDDVAEQYATGFATSFSAAFPPQFAAGFAPAFADAFATGFAAQVAPSFSAFSGQFSEAFAEGVAEGLADEALPGIDQLLAGLNNPSCDRTDPTNPANPCGFRQVLQLLNTGSGDLAAGLTAAAGGAGELAGGIGTAGSGARDLSSGLGQLDDGAGQLAAGAGRARDGSRDLVSGLVQLDDGGRQLASGAGDARDGGRRLADGLVQLDDGANQLAEGLGDAVDGSGQLAEGAAAAAEGGGRVADGTVALSEQGLGAIIGGATEAAQEPSKLYHHLRAVDARGRNGEGLPYGTVDAVGANSTAVYQFQLAGTPTDSGPGAPLRILIALGGFALSGALAMALRSRLA